MPTVAPRDIAAFLRQQPEDDAADLLRPPDPLLRDAANNRSLDLRGDLADEWRRYQTGRDRIHTNTVVGPLDGGTLRQPNDCVLGGGVPHHIGVRAPGIHGGEVDIAPPPRARITSASIFIAKRFHARSRQQPVHPIVVLIQQRLQRVAHARDIDREVEAAEAVADRPHRSAQTLRTPPIALHERNSRPMSLERGNIDRPLQVEDRSRCADFQRPSTRGQPHARGPLVMKATFPLKSLCPLSPNARTDFIGSPAAPLPDGSCP